MYGREDAGKTVLGLVERDLWRRFINQSTQRPTSSALVGYCCEQVSTSSALVYCHLSHHLATLESHDACTHLLALP